MTKEKLAVAAKWQTVAKIEPEPKKPVVKQISQAIKEEPSLDLRVVVNDQIPEEKSVSDSSPSETTFAKQAPRAQQNNPR